SGPAAIAAPKYRPDCAAASPSVVAVIASSKAPISSPAVCSSHPPTSPSATTARSARVAVFLRALSPVEDIGRSHPAAPVPGKHRLNFWIRIDLSSIVSGGIELV